MNTLSITIALVTLLNGAVSEIDLQYVDDTVDPCDDFHKFACGNFDKHWERPQNQSLLDLFTITENKLVQIGKEILESPKRQQDPIALRKAKSAYRACVDVVNVDGLSYYQTPENQIIEEFGGLPLVGDAPPQKISWTEIAELSGKFGIHYMFEFLVKNFDPETYILIMSPVDNLDKPEMIRPRPVKTYDEVLEDSFKKIGKPQTRLLGEEDPLDIFIWKISKQLLRTRDSKEDKALQKDLEDVKEFMAHLFAGGIIDDEMTEIDDLLTLKDLQNWTQQQFGDEVDINWVDYYREQFKWAGFEITEDFMVYLIEKDRVYGILNLVRKTDPQIVKNFILLKTFLYMAPDSDLPIRQAFEEYYKALGYQYYERPEYCARKILDVVDSASLSFAVTNEFVNYYFNINKISEAVKIIKNLGETFKTVLSSFDWVDDESRDAVVRKLNNIIVYLGYPDFVDDKNSLDRFYENVRICEWDNYGNARKIRAFKQAYAFTQYLDHEMWANSPFEVNAFAIRASNRIMLPLAMLHSSYLTGDDPVFDYSRFGGIIAHEFIHHFDSTGVLYDENGSMGSLISNSSYQVFKEKAQCFIDQYNKYYVEEVDSFLDGSNTLNENMADNSGLKHAFAAFKKVAEDGSFKKKIGKYNIYQQFFISYATSWCSDESFDYLNKLVQEDPHSPNRFRVLGTLSNMDEFSEAFGCPVGSNMNPETKCVVW